MPFPLRSSVDLHPAQSRALRSLSSSFRNTKASTKASITETISAVRPSPLSPHLIHFDCLARGPVVAAAAATVTQGVKARNCGIIRGIIFTCSSTRSPLCLMSNIFISSPLFPPDPISSSENACNNCAEDARGWPHAEMAARLGSSF